MKYALGVVLISAAMGTSAVADVYKCKNADGSLTFSGQPCSSSAEKIKVVTPVPSTDDVKRAKLETERLDKYLSDSKKEREILDLERKIKDKEQERDSAVAMIKRQQATANNNLAGAQYYAGLATEMQAVNERYQGEIEVLKNEIEQKKKE